MKQGKSDQRTTVGFERERLGKVASVLLPLEKLKRHSPRSAPFEDEIHHFLLHHFSGYTVASGNISGHWKDKRGKDQYGEHREYRIALCEDHSFGQLEEFLAKLANEMEEVCIYTEFGSEIFLIYGRKPIQEGYDGTTES